MLSAPASRLSGPFFPVKCALGPALLTGSLLATPALFADGHGNRLLEEVHVTASAVAGLRLDQPTEGASRLGLSAMELPASVFILDGDLIRRWGDATLNEAISRATGVSISASPGNGGSAIAARGFSGHGSVMQLYNGSRLYVGSGTLSFPFDPWSVERVEVLQGPASVLYGEGAIGGAVNVVSKQPSDHASSEGRVAFGSDATRRLAFGATGPVTSGLAYRFDISHNQSDGWVDDGHSKSLAVSGALRWQATENLTFRLAIDDARQEPMRYFGVPLRNGQFLPGLQEANFNVADAHIDYQDRWVRASADWQPATALAVSNEIYWLTSDRHWRNAESYRFVADDLVRRTDFLEILHDQEQIGNRFQFKLAHQLFGLANEAVVGFDVNRVRFTHGNNAPYSEDPLAPSLLNPLAPTPGRFINLDGTADKFRTETRQWSLFFEDRLRLSDRLTLVAGARYDEAQFERFDLVSPQHDIDKRFYMTNWRTGLIYNLSDDLVVYGQYATGSDPLGSLITTSASQIDFDLSDGKQWEIGLKQQFANGRGQWTLAWYDIRKRKLLSRDPDNPTITQQVGERSARGVEAAFAFELAQGWHFNANATALRARFEDFKEVSGGTLISRDGRVPAGIPERTANLWLSWQPHADWSATLGMRYVGKRYVNNANSAAVDSYQVWDAGLHWYATDNMRLALRVFNLTDELYTTSSSTAQWRVAQPRSWELSADFRF